MFIRKEIFGNVKVNITDKPMDTLRIAREMAAAQSAKASSEPIIIGNLDARSSALVAKVIARKTVLASSVDNPSTRMHYFVDGVYESFNFSEQYSTSRPLIDKEGELYQSTIWDGPCDSRTKIESNKSMRKLDVGEWIVYEDISTFNCSSTPIYVISESLWNDLAMKSYNNRDD